MKKGNNLLIFDTDTVFALSCSVYDRNGYNLIYEIKGRELTKPLAVLAYNLDQIKELCFVNDIEEKVIKSFLPGPLTLILKTKPEFAKSTNYATLGVRIPNNDNVLAILKEKGPLFATSLNNSGEEPLTDINLIKDRYSHLVSYIYPFTVHNKSDLPSTVVKLENNELLILRNGEISKSDILKVL